MARTSRLMVPSGLANDCTSFTTARTSAAVGMAVIVLAATRPVATGAPGRIAAVLVPRACGNRKTTGIASPSYGPH